ncbi:hypothetical protein F5Y18DRAFT_387611 [Xylariaceae sp. FL1019]|nr:hypothetical protein F5Y18DRAFT_387611 [Xylariaceae sp. FL1019]
MSSMFKKGGGLSFKPKAGRRPGAAARPAAASSASASTTPAPAPTTTHTPTPAAEPTQPQPDVQPESQDPTPTLTTSKEPAPTATAAEPDKTTPVNSAVPASSEPSSATQAPPSQPEPSAASLTLDSTSQAEQPVATSSVPPSREAAQQPSPIVQQRTPLPTQQASPRARRSSADTGPPTPAPAPSSQDTRPTPSIEEQDNTNVLNTPIVEVTEAPATSPPVLEPDANANTTANATTPTAEEPPVSRRPLPKKAAPKKRKSAATSGEAESEGPAPKKTRQRKPRAGATDNTGEEASTDAQPAKKRKPRAPRAVAESGEGASTEPRPEKQRRKRAVTPEDAENQKVDHTTMTVGELVKDLGIGKPFKHAEEIQQRAREARAANQLKRLERQKIRAGLVPAPQSSADKEGTAGREARGAAMAEIGASMDSGTSQGVGYDVIDGQIVVSQSTLVVNRHNQDVSNYEEVEENEFTTLVTSSSYLKKKRGFGGWSDDETERFYQLLGQFGIDFEAISNFFPLKSRDQCRRKFIKEERTRPNRVNAAIMVRGEKKTEINIDEYKATQLEWFSKDKIEAEQNKLAEEHGKEIGRLREERRAAGLMDDDNENTPQDTGKGGPGKSGPGQEEEEEEEFEEEDADALGLNGGVAQSIETS